jgi:hypothetical protein
VLPAGAGAEVGGEPAAAAPAVTSHPEARVVSPNQDPYEVPTLKH